MVEIEVDLFALLAEILFVTKLVAQENVEFAELSSVEGLFFSSKMECHGKINSLKLLSTNPKLATLAAVLWNYSRERCFSLKWYKGVSVATSTISHRIECIAQHDVCIMQSCDAIGCRYYPMANECRERVESR